MILEWFKCKEIGWCELTKVDIENEYIKESIGVYVCWTGSELDNSSKIIKVGKGFIYDEILELRNEELVLSYLDKGVYFTWARCHTYQLDAIEVFLTNHFKPMIKNPNLSKTKAKKVSLPWDEEEIRRMKALLAKPSYSDEPAKAKE